MHTETRTPYTTPEPERPHFADVDTSAPTDYIYHCCFVRFHSTMSFAALRTCEEMRPESYKCLYGNVLPEQDGASVCNSLAIRPFRSLDILPYSRKCKRWTTIPRVCSSGIRCESLKATTFVLRLVYFRPLIGQIAIP